MQVDLGAERTRKGYMKYKLDQKFLIGAAQQRGRHHVALASVIRSSER